jgi:hypothetical protein
VKLISYEPFYEHVDSEFTIITPKLTPIITLQLQQTIRIAFDQFKEQFALIFQGPLHPLLSQQTFELEHEQLGKMQLFIVPVARDANGIQYEAVFNRLLSGSN